jgi:UDP-glucose 4-epimerase
VKLLLTGGAGYVGSVVARQLLEAGHELTVLDDLSRGHRQALPTAAKHAEVDLLDREGTAAVVAEGFEGVLHFAALALVGESVEQPEIYWRTNVTGTLNLLDGMREAGVRRLVFSSTCATYGQPDRVPIREDESTTPTNPYGESKLAVDKMIAGFCAAHRIGAVSLRYFNVAGASGDLGEHHEPETHLIPNVLRAAAGHAENVSVFGTDYPTEDGTAIRDYIHIEDLAVAHRLALDATRPGEHLIYNLGTGTGYSVRQVIDVAREVTGREIAVVESPRRPGDPARLVAASDRIKADLGWAPEKGLREIVTDAWGWHERHPGGYDD